MGKITLSLSDKTEKELRAIAKRKYSNMRGALSIIVEIALQEHFLKIRSEG